MLAFLNIGQGIIDVEQLRGRTQLHSRLNGLPIRENKEDLRALAIVCDADAPDDGAAAFNRVKDDLSSTGFTAPTVAGRFTQGRWDGGPALHVGVYIMPDNQMTGALEDLCLFAIDGDISLPCVDAYLQCVSSAGGVTWRPQDLSKARLRSWLASRADPTLLLGYAMNRNLIRRDHVAFSEIRQFLRQLAAAAQAPVEQPDA
jgi:hypothetical protein